MTTNKDAMDAVALLGKISRQPHSKDEKRTVATIENCEETIRNALQTQAELVEALRDLKEFFDVDISDGNHADDESIGWIGDKEHPTTFGQIRKLNKAILRAKGDYT